MAVKHPAPKGAQRVMFEKVATGDACPGGAASTRRALLDKGLIVKVGSRFVGRPPFQVELPEFEVPVPVHMQWCAWCAENVTEPTHEEPTDV